MINRRTFVASLAALLPLPALLRSKPAPVEPDVKRRPMQIPHEPHTPLQLPGRLWQCWQVMGVDTGGETVISPLGYMQVGKKDFFYPLHDSSPAFPLPYELHLLFELYGFPVESCRALVPGFLRDDEPWYFHDFQGGSNLYLQVPDKAWSEGRHFLLKFAPRVALAQFKLIVPLYKSIVQSLAPPKEDSDEARYREYHAVAGSRLGYRLRGCGSA